MIEITVTARLDERVIRADWERYRDELLGHLSYLAYRRMWVDEHAEEMRVLSEAANYRTTVAISMDGTLEEREQTGVVGLDGAAGTSPSRSLSVREVKS